MFINWSGMKISEKEILSNKQLLEKAYEIGFEYEKKYGNCAQCVLLAVQETLDFKDDSIFKAATGFAGGIGGFGISACGALSGGILAIGQKYGRNRKNFTKPRRERFKAYDLAQRLHQCFIEEYGNSACHSVQQSIFGRSFNLLDPVERQRFEDDGGHIDKCTDVVGKAAQWVVELLLEAEEQK